MKPNADLTVYTPGVDAATRSQTWTRSVILGVTWEDRRAEQVTKGGEIKRDRVYVYIPLAKGPVAVDAVIVRGVVSDEISPTFTITALKAKYPQSATVRSVDCMDRGSLALRHYQIGAS